MDSIRSVSGTSYQSRGANPVPGHAANVNSNTNAGGAAGGLLIDELRKDPVFQPLLKILDIYSASLGIGGGEQGEPSDKEYEAAAAKQYEEQKALLESYGRSIEPFEDYKETAISNWKRSASEGRRRGRYMKAVGAQGGLTRGVAY